ncbi:MAG TPA: hypothetical protein DCM86_11460 [Verrucomicrobiales bacterium]|nr:hypothetical protein [Verrucomicrobiales bacterium]
MVLCSLLSALPERLGAGNLAEAFTASILHAQNPSGGWGYGTSTTADGAFVPYAAEFYGQAAGSTLTYWGARVSAEPWVRQNAGPNGFTWPLQGYFPVHGISVAPGPSFSEQRYSIIRYTIPSDGRYHVEIRGTSTGGNDVDVHLEQDGVEFVAGNLATGGTIGTTNEQFYVAGTTIDISTGPGADFSNVGAVFQVEAAVDPTADSASRPPQITFNPARGVVAAEQPVELVNLVGMGEIRFTLDGTLPTALSTPYTGVPLRFQATRMVRAAVFKDGAMISDVYSTVFRSSSGGDIDPALGIPFEGGLAASFPHTGNPSGPWSLGYKRYWDGRFDLYEKHFQGAASGSTQDYWGHVANSESWIRQNLGPNPIQVPSQGVFPVRGLSSSPGPVGRPDQYAVARYTVASNGYYRVRMAGYASGIATVDVHYALEGVDLLGGLVLPGQSLRLDQPLFLTTGARLEVAVGTGPSHSNYGAIYQFDMAVDPMPQAPPDGTGIRFSPPRGLFTNEMTFELLGPAPGTEIRYTLNGRVPGPASPVYSGPIAINQSTLVLATVLGESAAAPVVYAAAYHRSERPQDGIPISWYMGYFGAAEGESPDATEAADPDKDGRTNLEEYIAGSDPTDPLSGFDVGIKSVPCVRFVSVPGQVYRILRSSVPGLPGVEIGRVTATGVATRFVDADFEPGGNFYRVEAVR